MASENETEKRETLADIVADLRAKARKFIGYHGVGWSEGGRLMSLADRIEEAWKREKEARKAAEAKLEKYRNAIKPFVNICREVVSVCDNEEGGAE